MSPHSNSVIRSPIDPTSKEDPPLPSVEELRDAILAKLNFAVGKNPIAATQRDWFVATALVVRDQMTERWMRSIHQTFQERRKRVYYLSLEFLVGRFLFDAITNLGLTENIRAALAKIDVDLDRLRSVEPDAALGNGGLGRLAACYMEAAATMQVAAYGYGIRYDHGLFMQTISDGNQHEYPEDWLVEGNPWEFARAEVSYEIGFGGSVEEQYTSDQGESRMRWLPADTVLAVAYDTPICGWRGKLVNTLRLWSARAPDPLRLDAFNNGDYVGAMADKMRAESISKVLYPSDSSPAGQELRLRQEYFFVSASLQNLVARHIRNEKDITTLPDFVAVQLNDTHPAIAIAELMRILVDLNDVEWSKAWDITQKVMSYTNHTLLPEALETWPVPLMERLLPRHMQIIYLINEKHLDFLRASGQVNDALLSNVSMIDEHYGRKVRMGVLAFVGSHRINGVSALHSQLLRDTLFSDLNQAYPGRILNVTNGITFRRWLYECNPDLTKVIIEAIGPGFLDHVQELEKLTALAQDKVFGEKIALAKKARKDVLRQYVQSRLGIKIDSNALYDVQVKRIHEYKRQLLNILETIALYNAMRAQPTRDWVPRVKIFAGKAATSYAMAKLIIKLANDVAKVVNSDPSIHGRLKVVFLPNYNVSLAEMIMPSADLSEQISTAGMEASGTGNMKLALNGALTIGTLDGANVEISERVGRDNIFIFGMTTDEVAQRRKQGEDATATINASAILREVLDAVANGVFSPDDRNRYKGLVDTLTYHDHFMVCADFDAYFATQRQVEALWRKPDEWRKASILNTAHMGWFSADRSIAEYAKDIWNIPLHQ